jgi:hypothetical protein
MNTIHIPRQQSLLLQRRNRQQLTIMTIQPITIIIVLNNVQFTFLYYTNWRDFDDTSNDIQ